MTDTEQAALEQRVCENLLCEGAGLHVAKLAANVVAKVTSIAPKELDFEASAEENGDVVLILDNLPETRRIIITFSPNSEQGNLKRVSQESVDSGPFNARNEDISALVAWLYENG